MPLLCNGITRDPSAKGCQHRNNYNVLAFPRQPLLRSIMIGDTSAKGCQPSNKYKFLDAGKQNWKPVIMLLLQKQRFGVSPLSVLPFNTSCVFTNIQWAACTTCFSEHSKEKPIFVHSNYGLLIVYSWNLKTIIFDTSYFPSFHQIVGDQ